MRYALLVSHDESAAITAGERSRRAAGLALAAGQLGAQPAAAERLQPAATAATVRCWDGGDVMVTRGPAASREQLTAFFVVDCRDEDAAIDAATRIPAAWYGSVEVRPVLADCGGGASPAGGD